jgi:hypothetical protein
MAAKKAITTTAAIAASAALRGAPAGRQPRRDPRRTVCALAGRGEGALDAARPLTDTLSASWLGSSRTTSTHGRS